MSGMATKWKNSDRPFDSEFLDRDDEHCSARVKPVSAFVDDGYEWSTWLGPPGRRVLHNSGEVRTRRAAKTIARRKLATCPRPR